MTPLIETPTYEEMRDKAVEAYHKEHKQAWKSLLICVLIHIAVVLLFVMIEPTFKFLWILVGVFIALLWIPKSIKICPMQKFSINFDYSEPSKYCRMPIFLCKYRRKIYIDLIILLYAVKSDR